MITITDAARAKLLELIETKAEEPGDYGVRVAIRGRGPMGFEYDLRIMEQGDKPDGDILAGDDELPVFVDGESADNLKGSTIDFVQMGGMGRGAFKIDNPNPVWSDPLAQAVQEVITNQINPGVMSHGGLVQLLDVKDNVAYIQLGGGCVGCGMVNVTLKQGVEVMIKEAVPQIEKVVDTTDHDSGTNPYYQPAAGGRSPLG